MNTTLSFQGLQSQSNYDVLNIKAGSLAMKGSNQMQNEMAKHQPQPIKL